MRRWIALVLTIALTMAACGGDDETDSAAAAAECASGQVDGDLDLYNWSEYIDPELVEQFESEYGVEVVETFYDSNEAMLAQVEAGGANYDLVVPSDYMVQIMGESDLLVPINYEALDNEGNLDSQFRNLPFDPDDEWSIPYQWGTTGIGVDMDVVGEDFEPSWALIFDPDDSYAGKISLLNDERETFGAALKYLGYSVNSTSESQLQEATDLIKSIKDKLAKFDSDQFEDDLVQGQTAVAHGYSGDFFAAFDEATTDDYDAYERYTYVIPDEGAVAWVDTMAIPVTADAPCTAHTFIDFILDPENGAALTNFNFYASPNAAATPFVDAEILEDETIYPSENVMARLEFLEDLGDFQTKYADAFSEAKN